MSDPLTPNYKKDVGRLVTDRFDFENHINGNKFRHKADIITVSPTLTVGSVEVSNVQQALTELLAAVLSPSIDDATTSSKGIIKLAGDISGTATNVIVTQIQSKPISSLTPSSDDVLTWDGYVWKPSSPINVFTAGGDLGGNNILQSVISLTGYEFNASVGNVILALNAVIDYDTSLSPLITQDIAATNHGHNITIRSQSATNTNKNGGTTIIAGGAPGSGGLKGGVTLQFTSSVPVGYPKTSLSSISSSNMVQLSEPATGRRVLALCHGSDLSTTDMPANTGDMIMYIRDAVTAPTIGNPSNGTILYSSGGQLWIKQQDGNNFAIGSIPNPSVWGATGQQIYTYRTYVQSTTSAVLAFSTTLIDQTATKVDVMFVGKEVGANNSAQFNLSIGYTRHSGSPAAVGSLTSADPRTTAGASGWTVPTINTSGNTLRVYTGYYASSTIEWLVITQLTMSSSS